MLFFHAHGWVLMCVCVCVCVCVQVDMCGLDFPSSCRLFQTVKGRVQIFQLYYNWHLVHTGAHQLRRRPKIKNKKNRRCKYTKRVWMTCGTYWCGPIVFAFRRRRARLPCLLLSLVLKSLLKCCCIFIFWCFIQVGHWWTGALALHMSHTCHIITHMSHHHTVALHMRSLLLAIMFKSWKTLDPKA